MGARRNISGLDLAAGVGSIRRAWLTSDSAGKTDTTVANVTGLAVALEANATYFYRSFIIYSAGTVGDLSWSHSVPSGASMKYGDATNFYANAATTADVWSGAGTGISNARSFGLDGYITTGGTAGNLQARYAQAATDASNATVIHAGSWFRVERVA